jgi:anti-anti-sigma regulatory factor
MNSFQLETTPTTVLLRLSGETTIACASELLVALRTALRRPRELVVDAADLLRIDTAVLQVLLAATRAAPSFRFAAAPAPAWTAAVERYGLVADFLPRS